MACTVCGDPKVKARGRCGTCYVYWYRRGRDRGDDLVARLTAKDIERDLLRARRRARGWHPDI